MALTVGEAAATYGRAMRNVLPAGVGICHICHTFIAPAFSLCWKCASQPNQFDAVVPITYSEHLGQMHTALRNYKDGVAQVRDYAAPRLASILWLFLESHEACVARAAKLRPSEFDVVTTVPSSTPERDEVRGGLRWIVGTGCGVTAQRFERVLRSSGLIVPGRDFNAGRFTATRALSGESVLLIDDTWASGGHAQSAGAALREAGAGPVATVVIGRHIRPDWEITEGVSSGDRFNELPKSFSYDTCCVHTAP